LADVLGVPPDKFLIADKDTLEFLNLSHTKIKEILGESGYYLFLENLNLIDDETKATVIEFIYLRLKHRKNLI